MSLITITHTIGCDALGVARRVADGLNVEVYDDSRLKEEALRMGLHSDQLKGFREKPPDWFERIASDKPEMYLNLNVFSGKTTDPASYPTGSKAEGNKADAGGLETRCVNPDNGCRFEVS